VSTPSKTPPAAKATPADPAAAELSSYQKFEPRRVHRSTLTEAPYNPRTITDENRAWLKRKLRQRGLLKALVWNETTGRLVEGHQRLACLDALEGHGNYLLDVAVVQLTEAEEREENVAFNGGRTGDWDLALLADVLKTPDINLDATGFTVPDVQVMFDDADLATLFVTNVPTDDVLSEVERQTQAAKKAAKAKATEERREMLKKTGGASTDDTENFAVVVFKDRAQREAFMQWAGAAADDRYADGVRVFERLGLGGA
jgi:ParB-like chromosome segregation protein Spo0J